MSTSWGRLRRELSRTQWDVEHLPRPRKERSLPSILSTQEVARLINRGRTLKHQVFMVLLYGTGLRLSEALNLRIVDIDGQRQQLRIVKGKGAKGRYVSIPEYLLEVLRNYYLPAGRVPVQRQVPRQTSA